VYESNLFELRSKILAPCVQEVYFVGYMVVYTFLKVLFLRKVFESRRRQHFGRNKDHGDIFRDLIPNIGIILLSISSRHSIYVQLRQKGQTGISSFPG